MCVSVRLKYVLLINLFGNLLIFDEAEPHHVHFNMF